MSEDYQNNYEARKALYLKTLQDILDKVTRDEISLVIPRQSQSNLESAHFEIHLTPEFIYQVGGSTEIRFPDETCVIEQGQLCIVPRHTAHCERIVSQDGFIKFVGMIRPEGFSLHVSQPHTYENPDKNFLSDRYLRGGGSRIAYFLDEVVHAHRSDSTHRGLILRGLLISLIGLLLDGLVVKPLVVDRPALKDVRCMELIVENLSDPQLSNAQLAKVLHCSPVYLSRYFHQKTGSTITQVINEKRIEFAARLLTETSMSISEIAYATGYTNSSYFIKVFRKLKEETPGNYRLAQQSKTARGGGKGGR